MRMKVTKSKTDSDIVELTTKHRGSTILWCVALRDMFTCLENGLTVGILPDEFEVDLTLVEDN